MTGDILLIIDPQRGFFAPAWPPSLADRLASFLSKNPFDHVFATKFIGSEKSPFLRFTDWPGLSRSEKEICAELKAFLDVVIPKKGFSAATPAVLRYLKTLTHDSPQAIYLAGTDTEACVLASAMAFFEKGIRPRVLVDFCASSGGETVHRAGLLCLERAIGKQNLVYGDPSKRLSEIP